MPSTELQPPFDAYRGSGPYIFISYAHADAAVVFPDLLLIRALGASVWFDEGIDPGNEWPEDIARAIDRCALFVFFISRTSVSSRNCRNEVYFALTRDKPVVAIYLEETMVPRGIALSLSSTQAIMKFRMDADSYVRGLRKIIATISSPNMPSSTNAASAAGSLVPITGESPGGRAPLLWTKSSHTPRWIHHLYFCKMSAVEVTVTGILDKKVTLLGRHFLGIHDYVHLGESLPKIKKYARIRTKSLAMKALGSGDANLRARLVACADRAARAVTAFLSTYEKGACIEFYALVPPSKDSEIQLWLLNPIQQQAGSNLDVFVEVV